jgi:D-glycero-D-manno-heptose 1,7-bisphosphate phosphatase
VEEVEVLSGVKEALSNLRESGYLLLVVTNQPDIARGTLDAQSAASINDFLTRELPLDRIYVCPHDSEDGCMCRKPRPGLILRAATDFDIDLTASYVVGDRWRDIEAGNAAGCRTFFVDHSYQERQPVKPDYVVHSLAEAAERILSSNHEHKGRT